MQLRGRGRCSDGAMVIQSRIVSSHKSRASSRPRMSAFGRRAAASDGDSPRRAAATPSPNDRRARWRQPDAGCCGHETSQMRLGKAASRNVARRPCGRRCRPRAEKCCRHFGAQPAATGRDGQAGARYASLRATSPRARLG